MRALNWMEILFVSCVLALPVSLCADDEVTSPYAAWDNGPSTSPDFFPIAVWLQQPSNAPRFQEAGINLFVGLWRGPTREQLEQLKQHGMPVICRQNRVGLEHKDDPIIVGWMHDDEPDNAQSLGRGQGYGPPILPEKIVADYQQMREADPTRPVFLNLCQGVAWDNYIGRGVRRNRPEDYPQFISIEFLVIVCRSPTTAPNRGFPTTSPGPIQIRFVPR